MEEQYSYPNQKNATIKSSNFSENEDAVYLIHTNATIVNCDFVDNENYALYTYSSSVIVENSSFTNNTVGISRVFSPVTCKNTTFTNNNMTPNEIDYPTAIEETGISVKFINNTINVENIPSKFDLREWGWVTPVKNPGNRGSCWAFGTIGALESAILRFGGKTYDFSENNMLNNVYRYTKYGSDASFEGAGPEMSVVYLVDWWGAVLTQYDTYDELGKISPYITTNQTLHVQNVKFIKARNNATDNDELKRAILEYGGTFVSINCDFDEYNQETFAFYQKSNDTNHIVTFIGWDDNFSASNFKTTPPGDGAFIFKNSWGKDSGDEGYYYISYYDVSILNNTFGVAFLFLEDSENYTKNYQTDFGGYLEFFNESSTDIRYQNNYKSLGNDLISAVGTYFHTADENYTLQIFVNGELKYNKTATKPYYGYSTIKLSEEIPIKKGDNISISMLKKTAPVMEKSLQHYQKGVSLMEYEEKYMI